MCNYENGGINYLKKIKKNVLKQFYIECYFCNLIRTWTLYEGAIPFPCISQAITTDYGPLWRNLLSITGEWVLTEPAPECSISNDPLSSRVHGVGSIEFQLSSREDRIVCIKAVPLSLLLSSYLYCKRNCQSILF